MDASRITRTLVVSLFVAGSFGVGTVGVAQAGQGPSQDCHDGNGFQETPIMTNPASFGLETHTPTTGFQATWIQACWSTTPTGAPGPSLAGGTVIIYAFDTGYVGYVACAPDPGAMVGTSCYVPFWYYAVPEGLGVRAGGNVGVVTVGRTGVTLGTFGITPGPTVGPYRPCLWVNGSQVLPGCGTPIL